MGKNTEVTKLNKETVKAFADNNMRILSTARSLYMTYNSVDYHLNRVKAVSGLDPRNFYDLIKLLDIWKEEER